MRIRGSSRIFSCDKCTGVLVGATLVLLGIVATAVAEVHFGNNVYIGGHDFSHQTFNRRHRAVVTLYDRPIRHQGCVTRRDGHGGTVKKCRLQTIRR